MNCDKCGININETNYCENCGTPISPLAKEYEKVKKDTIKLELLNELMSFDIDDKTKNVIKNMIDKI